MCIKRPDQYWHAISALLSDSLKSSKHWFRNTDETVMQSVPILTNFLSASSRKRLWLAGLALGVFLVTLVVGNQMISADRSVTRQMLGHDFLAFYTAGSFVRQGRVNQLYELDQVKAFEQSTAQTAGLEVGKSFGPWWNPPFYALVFEPLAALPYATALDVWRWISLTAGGIAIALLARTVWAASLVTRWQQWALVPLLVVISMPFIQALSHAQNTLTSLLLLTTTVMLWRKQRNFLAGCCCGLLFYKPQLGALVAAVMVLDLGWSALGGLCVTGTVLLSTTLLLLPGSMGDWLHQLPLNVRWMQVDHAYLWERHVTLKAFWRLLLQGREAGEATLLTSLLTWVSQAVIGGGLAWAAIQNRISHRDSVGRDRLISATIAAMPLLMPFYFDYDLLLLAVPAVLYAAEFISNPERLLNDDRWITARWAALYACLFFNPAVALHTHISVSVLLLVSLAAGLINRVNRADGEEATILILHPQRLAMAA